MGLFSLEQSRFAYRADFALYGVAALLLAGHVAWVTPQAQWLSALRMVVAGLVAWTLTEYLLHRFVLHGVSPFRDWHAEHHRRPAALICSPTIFTGTLFIFTVYLPAWWVFGLNGARAFTLGMMTGYLGYATMHHALHHWRSRSSWFGALKRRHALHHAGQGPSRYFGVTSTIWDFAFGTLREAAARRD
jgi:cyclopropane-fatty-acyl-phospholipid synthase